jgi:GNAT superfamily N-acetyltransferase
MIVREATPMDVPAMHAIRLRVRENQLRDPSVVTERDYHDFMMRDTKSWICEADGVMAGFVMVDVEKQNLWALFVAPEHEFKGVGRVLHDTMIKWYATRADRLRLSTAPSTRAATFYQKAGYRDLGLTRDGRELIFELHCQTTNPLSCSP